MNGQFKKEVISTGIQKSLRSILLPMSMQKVKSKHKTPIFNRKSTATSVRKTSVLTSI